jgi:3-deoxy-manno-octulosonate cytidylyltransferase (CMP-KDO synthetase)
MSSTVVLIPARFGSSRFPGKPLALINGKSMIERVYSNCLSSGFKVAVVTDNDAIESAVVAFGGSVLRVDDDVPSGSERIALAFERNFSASDVDLVINVQGDEPLLRGEVLRDLAEFHRSSTFEIATLVRERSSSDTDLRNPNVVKAVWSEGNGQCLYFSRQALPFDRDGQGSFNWHQHVGVYSYKPAALSAFVKMRATRLEDLEKLEQLRALENNFRIGALLTDQELIGVDTPSDIARVEGVL